MLEQLKKYWAKVGEHPFLKHLFIIVCVLLVLGVATTCCCCWARATVRTVRCPT